MWVCYWGGLLSVIGDGFVDIWGFDNKYIK